MSQVRWCDAGRHPFAVGSDPDEKEYIERTPQGQGNERKQLDICGPCTRKSTESVTVTALASSDSTVVNGH